MPSSPTVATNNNISTTTVGAGSSSIVTGGGGGPPPADTPTARKKVVGLLESQRRLEEDIQTDLGLVAQAFDTYTTEGARPNGLTFRKDANQRVVMHEKQRQQQKQQQQHQAPPLLMQGESGSAADNNNNADRDDAIRAQRIENSKQRVGGGRGAVAATNPLTLETDAALLAAGYDGHDGVLGSPTSRTPSSPNQTTGGSPSSLTAAATNAKQRHLVDTRGGIPLYPLIHQALPYAMFRKFHPSQGDVALRRKAMPKVLIADDNKLHLMASKVIFEKYFETVHVCTTGKGVLEAMQRTVYDLILLDFDMSGINESAIALRPDAPIFTTTTASSNSPRTTTMNDNEDTANPNTATTTNASLATSSSSPVTQEGLDPLTGTPIKTIKDVSYSNYAPDIADTIRAVENAGKFETKSLIVCMMTKEQAMDDDIMERCQLSSLDRFILKPLIHHVHLIRDAISTSSITETFRRTVLEKKWFSNRVNTIALLQGTAEEQERVHKLVQASNPDYANEAHITTLFDDSPDERLQIETLLARQRDEELHVLRDEVCTLRNEVNELSYRNEQLEVENCVLRKDQHLETIWRLQRQVESLQADLLASTRREEEERDRAKQIETDLRNLLESGSKNEKHVQAAVRHALQHRKALERKEQVCMELLDTASNASWYNYYGSIEVRSLEGIASETLPKFATDVGTSWFREQLSKMVKSIERLSSSLLSEVLSTKGDITRAVREAAPITTSPQIVTSPTAAFSPVPSRAFSSAGVGGGVTGSGGGAGLAAHIDQITTRLKEVATAAEENLGGMIRALEEGVANMMVREHTLWSMIEKEEGGALNKELSTIQGFIREQRSKKLNNSVESQTEVWREIGKESYNSPPIDENGDEDENDASASTKARMGDTLQTVGVETMKAHIAARRNIFADPSLVLAQLPTVNLSDGVRFVPPSLSAAAIHILSGDDDDGADDASSNSETNDEDSPTKPQHQPIITSDHEDHHDNTFLTGTGAVTTTTTARKKGKKAADPDADLDDLEDLLNAGVDANGRALTEVDIGAERRRIVKLRRERFDSRAEKRAKKEARQKRRQRHAEKRAQLEEEEKEFKRRITYLQQSTLLQDISCHDLLPLLHNNTTFISQSVREKMIFDVFDKVAAYERGVKSKVATIARALYDQLEVSDKLMETVQLPGLSSPSQHQHQSLLSTFALKRAHIQTFKNEGLPTPPEALLLTSDVDTFLESVSPTLRDEYYQQQDNLASMFPLLHALYQDHTLAALNLPQHATQQDDAPLETLFNACDNVVPITRLLLEKLSIHSAMTLGAVSTPNTNTTATNSNTLHAASTRRSIQGGSISSVPGGGRGGGGVDSAMSGAASGVIIGGSSLQIAFSQLGHAIRADLPEDICGLPSIAGGATAMIGAGLARNASMTNINSKSTRVRQVISNRRGAGGTLSLKDRLAKAMAMDAAKVRGGGSGGGQDGSEGDPSGHRRQDPIAAVQYERAAIKNHLWSLLATSRKGAAAKDSEIEAAKAKKIEMRKIQKKRLKKKRRMDEAIAKKRIERAQEAEEREAANAVAIANGEEPIPDTSVRKRRGGRKGGRRATTTTTAADDDFLDEISDMNTAEMSSSEGGLGGGGGRKSDGNSPGGPLDDLSPLSESDDPFEEVELLSDGEMSGALLNAASSSAFTAMLMPRGSSVVSGPTAVLRSSLETQRPSIFSNHGSRSDSIFNVPPPLHQHGNKLTAPNATTKHHTVNTATASSSSSKLVNVSSLLYHEDSSSAPTLIAFDSNRSAAAGGGGGGDSPLPEYLFFEYDPDTDHVPTTTLDEYDDNDSVLSGSFATESSLVNGSFRMSSTHGDGGGGGSSPRGSVGMSSPTLHHHQHNNAASSEGIASSPIPPSGSPSPRVRRDRKGRMASKPIPAGMDKAQHIKEEKRMVALMTNIAVVAEAANRLDTESHKTASSIAEFAQGKVVGAMLRNATALSGAGRGSSPPSSDVSGRVNQQSQAAAGFDRPTVAVSMKELALLQKRLQQTEDERDDLRRQNLLQQQRADASAGKTNADVAAQLQALNAKRAKQKDSFSFEHWFSMADVAKIFDVDVSEMRALNPALPPSLGDFDGLEKAASSSLPSSAQGGSKPSPTTKPPTGKFKSSTKTTSMAVPPAVIGDGDIVLHIPISITMAAKVFAMEGAGEDDEGMEESISPATTSNRNSNTNVPRSFSQSISATPSTSGAAVGTVSSKTDRKSVFGSGALLGVSNDGAESTSLRPPSPSHSIASSGGKRRSNLTGLLTNALQDNSVLKAAAVKQYHEKLAKLGGGAQTVLGAASGPTSAIASPHGSMTSRPSIAAQSTTTPAAASSSAVGGGGGVENSGQPKPTDSVPDIAAPTTTTMPTLPATDQPTTSIGDIPAANVSKKGTLRIKSNFHHKLLQAILRTQHDIIASHAKEDQVRDTKNKMDFVEATLAAGGKDEKGRMVSEWGKYMVDHSKEDGSYALERRVASTTTTTSAAAAAASISASNSAMLLANGAVSSSFASPSGVWRSLRVVDRSTCTTDDTILSLSMVVPPPSLASSNAMVATTRQVKINPPSFTIPPVTSVNSSIRTIHHEVGRLNKEFDLVTRSQRARRRVFLRQKYLHHYHRSGTKDGVPRPPVEENPSGTGYLYSSLPTANTNTTTTTTATNSLSSMQHQHSNNNNSNGIVGTQMSMSGWNSVKMPSIVSNSSIHLLPHSGGGGGEGRQNSILSSGDGYTVNGDAMSTSNSGTHIPPPLPPGSSPGGAFSRASTARPMEGAAAVTGGGGDSSSSHLFQPLSALRDNRDAYLMAEAKDAMKQLNIPTPVDILDTYLTAPIVVSTQQDDLLLTSNSNKKNAPAGSGASTTTTDASSGLVPSLPSLDTIQALRRLISSFGLRMPSTAHSSSYNNNNNGDHDTIDSSAPAASPLSAEEKMAALLKAIYAVVLKIPGGGGGGGAMPEGMSVEDVVLIEAAVKAAAQFVEGTTAAKDGYEGLLCIPRTDCPQPQPSTTADATSSAASPQKRKIRGSIASSDVVPTVDVGSEEGGLLKMASSSSTPSSYNPAYLWERFVIDMEDILFDEELSRIAADREEDAAEHRKLIRHQTSGDISGLNTDGVDGADGTVGGASEWAAFFTDFMKDIGSTPNTKKRQERAEKLRKERRLASRKAFESDMATKPSFLLNVRLHDILHVSRYICGIEADPHPSSTTSSSLTPSPSSAAGMVAQESSSATFTPPRLKERVATLLLSPYPNEQLPYPTCTDADDILRLVEVLSRQVGAMVELALAPPVNSLTPFQARRLHYVAASTGTSATHHPHHHHHHHDAPNIASMKNNGSAVLGFRTAVTTPLLADNATDTTPKPEQPSTPGGGGFPKLRDRFKRAVVTVIDQQNKAASREEGAKRLLKGAILYETHPTTHPTNSASSRSATSTTISVTAERREWVFIPPQAFITHELSSTEISRFFVSEESSVTFLNATATVNKVKNLAAYLAELYPGVGAESIIYWNTGGRNPYHLQKSTTPIKGADNGLDGDVLLDPRVVMSDVQRNSTNKDDDIHHDDPHTTNKPLYEQFSSGTGFLNPAYAQMALKPSSSPSSSSEPIRLRIPIQDREQFIARVMWHGDQLRRRHVLLLSTCLKERRQVDPEGLAWLAAAVQLPLDHLRAAVSLFSRAQKLFYHDCGYGGVLGGVGLPAGLVIDEPHMDDGAVWDDVTPPHSASTTTKKKKIRRRPVSASSGSGDDMSEDEDGVRRPRPRSHLFGGGAAKSHSPSRNHSLDAPHRAMGGGGDRASIFPMEGGASTAHKVGVATRKQHSIERHMARLKRVRAMGTHIVTEVVPTTNSSMNSSRKYLGGGSGGNSMTASPESTHIEVPAHYSHRASVSMDALAGHGPNVTHLLSSQHHHNNNHHAPPISNTNNNNTNALFGTGVGNSRSPSTQRVGRGFSSNPASNAATPRATPNRGSPGKGTRFGVGAGRAKASQLQQQQQQHTSSSPIRTFLGISAATPPIQLNQARASGRHQNTTSPQQHHLGGGLHANNPLTVDGGGGGGSARHHNQSSRHSSISSSSAPFTHHQSSNSLHSATLNPHHYPDGPLSSDTVPPQAVDSGVYQRQRSTSIGRANRQGSIRSELMLDGGGDHGGGGLLLVAGSGLGVSRKPSMVPTAMGGATEQSSSSHQNLSTFVPLHNNNNNNNNANDRGSVSAVTSAAGGGNMFGESPLVGFMSSNASFSKSGTTDIRRGSLVKTQHSSFATEQLHRHQRHDELVHGGDMGEGGGGGVGGSDSHHSSSAALMSFVQPKHQSATNLRGGGGGANNEDIGTQSLSMSLNDVLKNRSTTNSTHRRQQQPMRGSPLHGGGGGQEMGSSSTTSATPTSVPNKRAGSPMVVMGHSTRGQPELSPSVTSKDFAPPPPQRRVGGLGVGGDRHGVDDKDAVLAIGGMAMSSSSSHPTPHHHARRGGGHVSPRQSQPQHHGRGGGVGLEEVSIIGGVSLMRRHRPQQQQHHQSTRRSTHFSTGPLSSSTTTNTTTNTSTPLTPAPPHGAVHIHQGPSTRRFNAHTTPALRQPGGGDVGPLSSSATGGGGADASLSASILQTALSTHQQHNHNGPPVDTISSSPASSMTVSSQRITLNRGVIRGAARFGSPSASASIPPEGLQVSGNPASSGLNSQFGWGNNRPTVHPTPPHAGRPGAPSSAPSGGGVGDAAGMSSSGRNVVNARRLTPPSIPPSLAFHRDK